MLIFYCTAVLPRPIWIFKKFRLEVKDYGLQQSQRRKEMTALERSRGKADAEPGCR
ncbi:hypothetical protein BRYFOR_09168 [Marvinbryantia formatexigens DSM 14469]|uniref:Uncharacterized protein n=1 Tax=Marvinbryantia formatexigens DSM 14469 TaxID=478749 RepID=C6LKI1_9FIRM|nr:hypothetical protein BRYFOR_09168 [Marvinbryantia formatexigens DSM 14469]